MPTGGQPQEDSLEEPQIASSAGRTDRYKWIALSNTTLGILMVTINQSILLISLPALFRGIKLNPLASGQHLVLPVGVPRGSCW